MKSKAKKLVVLTSVTTSVLFGLLGCNIAKAADSSNSGDAVYQITNGISSALGFGTINTLSGLFIYFQDCENAYQAWVLKTMQNNNVQATITSSHAVQQQSGKDTTAFVFNALTAPLNGSQNTTPIAGLPMTYSPGVFAALVPVNRNMQSLVKSTYISGEALFSGTKFSGDAQRAQAATFIQFLADAGAKIKPLNQDTLQKADPTLASEYLNQLATYNAGQAVGLNALYNLYNERIPLPKLNGESALSTDENQALVRMQPAWTESVSKMTIVDVMRESLYTQAEMNYQLFQMRMQMEQLTAVLATMEIQQQQTTSKSLLMSKQQQVIQSANSGTTTQQ